MKSINRFPRVVGAFAFWLLCTVAISAGTQPNKGKICDLHHLALLIDERYARPGLPIATYEVLRFDGLVTPPGRRTFVVIAQGVTDQASWDYWLAQIARSYPANAASPGGRALSNVTPTITGNSYAKAILSAAGAPEAVPPGSNLILVGHSLGGMEHQNLVRALKQLGFSVPYVVTFGSPVVARPDPGTRYRYVKADGDLIAAADQVVANALVIRIPGGSIDPFDFKQRVTTFMGSQRIGASRHLRRPQDAVEPCLEIDLLTRRDAPSGPRDPPARTVPLRVNRCQARRCILSWGCRRRGGATVHRERFLRRTDCSFPPTGGPYVATARLPPQKHDRPAVRLSRRAGDARQCPGATRRSAMHRTRAD
jgi:hypothetical protein